MKNQNILPCLIVGAGISGLTAVRSLNEAGVEAIVLDKGRGVGGRLSTRRFEKGVFDHGAQFFTVRDDGFRHFVSDWEKAGIVNEWGSFLPAAERSTGGKGGGTSIPRMTSYRGSRGMNTLPKFLAGNLGVRLGKRVHKIEAMQDGWRVYSAEGEILTAASLILTAPVPQSLALLDAGDFTLPAEQREELESITYEPCLAVLALLDGQSQIPEPGGLELLGDPLVWIADNMKKGISPSACGVTIHAAPDFSREHLESDLTLPAELMIDAAKEWLGADVVRYQAHRWRYSKPLTCHPAPFLQVKDSSPLLFAGDAFGGRLVEGAVLSGLAAARQLIETLKQ